MNNLITNIDGLNAVINLKIGSECKSELIEWLENQMGTAEAMREKMIEFESKRHNPVELFSD